MIMRKKIVAGNWKMNMTRTEALELVHLLRDKCNTDKIEVIFIPPFTDIEVVGTLVKDTNIKIGAQNFYFEDKGAFTGEISSDMLLELGCKYVIIGHSERRQIFKEDNDLINKKVIKAVSKHLTPIICCGETLEQREKGETLSFIKIQIVSAYNGLKKEEALNTIIAYEPIWAIGTGKTATSDEAEAVCKHIRETMKELYDNELSENIKILYGGSVNSKNCKEIFLKEDIDGGLVGGASLKEEFINIVNF